MWGSSSFQETYPTEICENTGNHYSIKNQAKLKGLNRKIEHTTRMDSTQHEITEN